MTSLQEGDIFIHEFATEYVMVAEVTEDTIKLLHGNGKRLGTYSRRAVENIAEGNMVYSSDDPVVPNEVAELRSFSMFNVP